MIIAALASLLTGSVLLLWSGLAHVRGFGAFHAALVAHRIIPYAATRSVARVQLVAELLIGASGVAVSLAAPWLPGPLIRSVAALVVAFYAVFAGYIRIQLRRAPGLACGCFGDEEPTSMLTFVRAVLLALVALGMVLLPTTGVGLVDIALAAGAAVPYVVVLRHLPALSGGRMERRS